MSAMQSGAYGMEPAYGMQGYGAPATTMMYSGAGYGGTGAGYGGTYAMQPAYASPYASQMLMMQQAGAMGGYPAMAGMANMGMGMGGQYPAYGGYYNNMYHGGHKRHKKSCCGGGHGHSHRHGHGHGVHGVHGVHGSHHDHEEGVCGDDSSSSDEEFGYPAQGFAGYPAYSYGHSAHGHRKHRRGSC